MRKLLAVTAAAAMVAVFGFAGTANADEFADVKESFAAGAGSSGDGTEALGSPDGTAVTLGDGGVLILQFKTRPSDESVDAGSEAAGRMFAPW